MFVCVPAGGLWRCDRVLSIGVAVPCQSQSVESVSVVRSTGRSISHNSPVSFSISLSVSVGACTKSNTRPRALTSAVRSSALSTSSSISSFHPLNLSRAHVPPPVHHGVAAPIHTSCDRTERIASPESRNGRFVLSILGHAGDLARRWASGKSRPRKRARDAEEHDEEGRESGTRKRRTMHRRPTWVPRTKLTRYVKLSVQSLPPLPPSPPPPLCIYTDI